MSRNRQTYCCEPVGRAEAERTEVWVLWGYDSSDDCEESTLAWFLVVFHCQLSINLKPGNRIIQSAIITTQDYGNACVSHLFSHPTLFLQLKVAALKTQLVVNYR